MGRWWDVAWMETRRACRSLVGSPVFSLSVVAALGLGVGANAAMFELVDGMLLRAPAHLVDPGSVRRLYVDRALGEARVQDGSFSYPALRALTAGSAAAGTLAGVSTTTLFVASGEEAQPRPVDAVSASWWTLFDVRPVIGRLFGPDEDALPSGEPVAVLSFSFWRGAYGGDPAVLGRTVRIGTRAYTVVGVLPADFHGLDTGVDGRDPVAFVPITAAGADIAGPQFATRPFTTWLELVTHLRPGIDEGLAAAELERGYRAHLAAVRDEAAVASVDPRVVLTPGLRDRGPYPSAAARISVWLLGMSWVVLLVACANVATLVLGRALRRRRETAVRAALGIGRVRLLGGAVAETALLAAASVLVALPLAQGTVRILARVLAPDAAMAPPGLGGRALVVALAMSGLAGVLAAVAPALQVRRVDLAAVLRTGGGAGRRGGSAAQTGLLVAQAAFSTLLLIAAGLFVRSVRAVSALDLGYRADRIVVVSPEARSPLEDARGVASGGLDRSRTVETLARAARSVAGVRSVALSATVPFWRNSFDAVYRPDGQPLAKRGAFATHVVSGAYFEVMGTAIVRGRALAEADDEGAPPVMVVSESMARRAWPGQEALGRCLRVGADTMPCREVVGVARDIRRGDIAESGGLQFYVPWRQFYYGTPGVVVVRTDGRAAAMVPTLRTALQQAVGTSAWVRVQALEDRVALQTRTWSVGARVFSAFGALALVLAALGLFSVVAYDVAQRTREFGVRMAVGARALDLVALVLRGALRMTAPGVGVGLLLAWALGRPVQPLLFSTSARDPATFVRVAALLLLASAVAGLAPALASARVEPQRVLRSE